MKLELDIIWATDDGIAMEKMAIDPHQVDEVTPADWPHDEYDYKIHLTPGQYARLERVENPLNFTLGEDLSAYFNNTYQD